MDVAPTLAFARRLAARRRPIWVRYVLVPGLTDDPEDIAQIAEFAAGLGNVERVDVLPFHQMGRYKWQQLGLPYTLEQTEPPSSRAGRADDWRSSGRGTEGRLTGQRPGSRRPGRVSIVDGRLIPSFDHPRFERRGPQPEPLGCAVDAADAPAACLERRCGRVPSRRPSA